MIDKLELHFPLEVEDEWPPVSLEGVLVTYVGTSQYRIETPPLFVKGLSVGDVINAIIDSKENIKSWQHVIHSGHSTIWLHRLDEPSEIKRVLEKLEEYGCQAIRLPQAGCYSVDVPESLDIKIVDEVLGTLDSDKVAVAYPSFRHHDEYS